MSREPPIEYAAMGRRHAGIAYRGLISSVQRQRLLALQDLASSGVHLASWERRELELLARLEGVGQGPEPSAAELAELQNLMASTTLAQLGVTRSRGGQFTETRTMSGKRAQLATLAARWPHRRLTGRQAICQLEEMRILGEMTPRQRAVWRMRP
jgi:hypothetical protein